MKEAFSQPGAFAEEAGHVNVMIETPRGSRVKYSYAPESGLFRAKRLLPERLVFPFNFGFIPLTLAADGDPVDILIVNDQPMVCGCLAKTRLLGVIEAEQTEGGKKMRNDRIIGLAVDEETPAEFMTVNLDEARIPQISFFFAAYNRLSGKEFKALRTGSPKEAEKLARQGMENFKNEKNKT